MRDIDVRQALMKKMEQQHYSEPDTRIVHELGLCQGAARVDVAVINGSFHGYEIKSERDTLNRLAGQRDSYCLALEYVTLVIAETHIDKAVKENLIPHWWGIWCATEAYGETILQRTREASQNPSLDLYSMAQFLWREEALTALTALGQDKGLRNKSRDHLWRRLVELVGPSDLASIVRQTLKARGSKWKASA